VALVAFVVVASMAADYGRVQVVKTELRRGADAAARAGAAYLGDYTTASAQAIALAGLNTADGQSIALTANDIEFGTWDSMARVFSPRVGTDRVNSNSIRVTARRTAATGNPVSLTFTGPLGMQNCDVKATAIASVAPTDFVIVGLDYVIMAGNSTDGYWPSNPSVKVNCGNLGSNGDITCKGTSYIHGNAHPGIGHTVIGASNVFGATTPLNYVLSYPAADPSPFSAANNDNNLLPTKAYNNGTKIFDSGSKAYTIPAGTYVVKDFIVGSASIITLSGPVVIYCYGTLDVKGNIFTYQSLARNFRLYMIPNPTTGAAPGSASLKSGGEITAIFYAPLSDIVFGSSFDLYGQVIGKSIEMTGSSYIHYDASLATNGGLMVVK
jgi:hypothetical protein